MKKSLGPPLLVPSLLWGGGAEDGGGSGGNNGTLYKVPFHTLGNAKRRYLRLKPFVKNKGNDSPSSYIEVALVDHQTASTKKYHVVRAACPLSLVWNDPKSASEGGLLSSPFKKGSTGNEREILLQDIVRVVAGNRTPAFQAFIAKNGSWSVPNEPCCFSLVVDKRSVDFYVQSAGANVDGKDANMAMAWRDAIQTLLDNFHRKQKLARSSSSSRGGPSLTPPAGTPSKVRAMKRWDSRAHGGALFEAARSGDVDTLGWFFDHCACPVDFMDSKTGDTVLMVACRLGLYDVARLALVGYNARNDPHPDFGQTALQVAVSAGHTDIVQLILETAEPSGADKIISNHEGENREAPLHVAARCGSADIMQVLIVHGANLGLVDGRGRTCLHCASQAGEVSCLALALDSCADEYLLEVPSHNDGFTPLHAAVRANKTECVKLLLRAGADVTAETADGSNIYNLASKGRVSEKITKLLLEYDVSEGDSHYDSYDEDDDDSSLGGEDDMFRGLNKYTVGGCLVSPAKQPPTNPMYSNGSPFAVGGLVSPAHQPLSHHVKHYNETSQLYAEAAAPLHSPFAGGAASSPIVGSSRHFDWGGNTLRTLSPHQSRVRFDAPYCRAEYDGGCYNYADGEGFGHGGEMWKIYVTHDGHPYFYNINQDSSSWEDPRSTDAKSQMIHPSQSPSPHESPIIMSSANETAVRNFSVQNHDRQTQPLSATQLQPPGAPMPSAYHDAGTVANEKPGNHSEQTSDIPVLNDHLRMSQHNSSSSSIIRTATNNPVVGETEQQQGNNAKPLSPAAQHSSLGPKRDEQEADPIKLQNPVLSSTPRSSMESRETDPKNMLLAEIKGCAIPPQPSTSAIEGRDTDPKSILLSQIKSRSVQNTAPNVLSKDESTATTNKLGKIVAESLNEKETPPNKLKNMLMEDEAVKKFVRMASVGVPVQAIAHKMKQEGVDTAKIEIFKKLHGLRPSVSELPFPPPSKTPAASSSKRQTYANVSKEELMKDTALSKYMKMKAVGVPLMAIVTKMSQDGIDKEKIHMFSVAFGLKTASAASPKPFPMPPIQSERRRASKAMQKIHWTTVAEERLQNSLWASNSDEEDKIKDSEIEKLESLFSASPIKERGAGGPKKIAVAKNDTKTKKPTSFIEAKRANNICISLAQFRAFPNFDKLCEAVVSLDGEHLNVEKLQNMQLLLPKPEELHSLERYNGQTDGFGRAELFFISVMKIPRFSQKLAAFIFTLQFDELARSLLSSLDLLAKACAEVVESTKLAGILRRLLAIGNLMNESSGKPQAKGITLDSLIKTAKKRGSDGKTMVIDLIVNTAMTNQLDIVEFRTDMPTVRDAMRLDLDDFRQMIREIQTGAQSVGSSIEAEKSQTGKSSSSEKYLTKLSPFLQRALSEIEDINILFGHVEGNVQSLCSFFAEDFKTCKASSIFAVLLEFSSLVDKSKEHHIRKEKAKRRREAKKEQKPN